MPANPEDMIDSDTVQTPPPPTRTKRKIVSDIEDSPEKTSQRNINPDIEDTTEPTQSHKAKRRTKTKKPRKEDNAVPNQQSSPTPTQPNSKGKQKATNPQTPPPQNKDQEMDIEEEEWQLITSNINTTSALTDSGKGGSSSRSLNIMLKFTEPPTICFDDANGPFRGLLASLKHKTHQERIKEISRLINPASAPKLLIAATGRLAEDKAITAIKHAISAITRTDPAEIQKVPHSAWIIATLASQEHVQELVKQRVVCDPIRKMLIVFREIQRKPSLVRIAEIRKVNDTRDLEGFERAIMGEGCKVSKKIKKELD
jgi:hypothetical protein